MLNYQRVSIFQLLDVCWRSVPRIWVSSQTLYFKLSLYIHCIVVHYKIICHCIHKIEPKREDIPTSFRMFFGAVIRLLALQASFQDLSRRFEEFEAVSRKTVHRLWSRMKNNPLVQAISVCVFWGDQWNQVDPQQVALWTMLEDEWILW